MNRWFILCVWLLTCMLVRAQGPDEQYVPIHNLIQEADQLAANGQPAQALAKYQEAQGALERFQRSYPNSNTDVVKFRQNYLATKVADLSAKVPAKLPAESSAAAPVAPTVPAETAAKLEQELAVLKEEVRQSQSERTLLEAKLKEALGARPSEIDPRQLAQAQEKIKALEKENEGLNAALAQAKDKPAAVTEAKASDQSRKAFEQARQALAEANLRLAEQTEKTAALEKQLKQLAPQGVTPAAAPSQPVGTDQVKGLTAERDDLRRKLDAALRELAARTPTTPSTPSAPSSDLATELVTLRTRLALYETRAAPYSAEELALMRVPETKLAAVAPGRTAPASPVAAATPAAPVRRDPPVGGTALAAEAQRLFSARQFEKAEATYVQLLRQEPDNVFTLANLAATELELNKLDDCQRNIEHAVKLAPDDAFSVSVLGHLKLRQKDYDAALEALGRAAQLDPQNAEVQNFLGVTFGQKGLRQQAESALRKAVQISPGYADAHNNLALIYLSQQPPMVQLARWHYQKALAAGSPARPELEKMLDAKQAAPSGK